MSVQNPEDPAAAQIIYQVTMPSGLIITRPDTVSMAALSADAEKFAADHVVA
jgi:hypothetical protein